MYMHNLEEPQNYYKEGYVMKRISLHKSLSLDEVLNIYNLDIDTFVNLQIGYDNNMYILLNEGDENTGVYKVIKVQINWFEQKLIYHELLELGEHNLAACFVQPIRNNILLVDSRCEYKATIGPANNAIVIDYAGNCLNELCLGDGIENCLVDSNGNIYTSYFDEGVYGNYGWNNPIGSYGVIVWTDEGTPKWKSKHPIDDCYAMSLDDHENLWYYYYDAFKLVKTNLDNEIVFDPKIAGSIGFVINSASNSLIFSGGYDDNNNFKTLSIDANKLQESETVEFIYNNRQIEIKQFWYRGSKLILLDANDNLFLYQYLG